MKKIYLLRHAKAEQNAICKDFDRKITKRGKQDLQKLFEALKSREIQLDMILASPAKRTSMTAKRLARFLHIAHITYIDMLYEANAHEIFALLQGLDSRAKEVCVVGHNPAIAELAGLLGTKEFDSFSTSSMVCFEFDIDAFSTLCEHSGRIVFIEYQKKGF